MKASERGQSTWLSLTTKHKGAHMNEPTVTHSHEDEAPQITITEGAQQIAITAHESGHFSITVTAADTGASASIELSEGAIELLVDELFAQIG